MYYYEASICIDISLYDKSLIMCMKVCVYVVV